MCYVDFAIVKWIVKGPNFPKIFSCNFHVSASKRRAHLFWTMLHGVTYLLGEEFSMSTYPQSVVMPIWQLFEARLCVSNSLRWNGT